MKTLLALLLALGTAHAATKWYPGHYQTLKGIGSTGAPPTWQRAHFQTALKHPKVKGFMLRVNWRDLEKARGVYDFSQIDQVLGVVGQAGKHAIVNIVDRSFTGEVGGNAPDYVAKMGCMFPMPNQKTPDKGDTKGLALKSYRQDCMVLFVDLYRAIGKRYDTDKRLWAVTIGAGESALDGHLQADYTGNPTREAVLIRAAQDVKQSFPTTLVLTGCNHPPVKNQAHPIADAVVKAGGSGLTHPDTVPGTDFPCTQVEWDHRKEVAIVPQGQPSQLDVRVSDLEHKVFDWAVGRIGAHAFIWADTWGEIPSNYVLTRVLPFLNRKESDWPAGSQECPSSLKPCITD